MSPTLLNYNYRFKAQKNLLCTIIQTYYIYYGIFPHGVNHWPVGRTTATTFVVGRLKESVYYVFEVSPGLQGTHSIVIKSKPKSGE